MSSLVHAGVVVEDLRDVVDFEGRHLRCDVRGPEGIIVEPAQKPGSAPG